MAGERPIVRLYFAPLSFPCGPQSSCCGPIGQREEEIADWAGTIEKNLAQVQIETINVAHPLRLGRDDAVLRLLRTFGPQACPIFTIDGEVVSMGPPVMEELVTLLRSKIDPRTSQVEA